MAEEKKTQAQIYQNLAYGASLEATRLRMIKDKLDAEIKLLNALEEYYDTMSELEYMRAGFGFDLNRL